MRIKCVIASLLLFSLVPVALAEERTTVTVGASPAEFRMRVVRRGDRYVGYHNNREYHLHGVAGARFKVDGDYVVHGSIRSDKNSIEVAELRPVEYRMRVTKRGTHYVGIYGDREYVLRGDAAARISAEGEYITYGEIGSDGTYFEVREVQPVEVRTVTVTSQPAEFRMRVVRRGDRYYGTYNNREYVLRGEPVTRITTEGEYTVRGEIGTDGTYIETREVQPVIVVQERQPIIIEEKRDPLIKLGPLEIGR